MRASWVELYRIAVDVDHFTGVTAMVASADARPVAEARIVTVPAARADCRHRQATPLVGAVHEALAAAGVAFRSPLPMPRTRAGPSPDGKGDLPCSRTAPARAVPIDDAIFDVDHVLAIGGDAGQVSGSSSIRAAAPAVVSAKSATGLPFVRETALRTLRLAGMARPSATCRRPRRRLVLCQAADRSTSASPPRRSCTR